jgi:hypothetical protein
MQWFSGFLCAAQSRVLRLRRDASSQTRARPGLKSAASIAGELWAFEGVPPIAVCWNNGLSGRSTFHPVGGLAQVT